MSGGGGKSKPVQTTAPNIEPVPTANIPVAQGPAFGPTATPNPYMASNAPSWATGWFSMPWWGQDPFGNNLSQAQMQYQPPPPPPPPQQQEAPQAAPRSSWADYQRDRSIYRNTMNRLGAGTDDYNAMAAWSEFGGPWSAAAARSRYSKANEYRYKPRSQWTMYDVQQAALRG